MSSSSYDPVSGVITLMATGFHTADQIAERSRTVDKLVETARRRHGRVRVLDIAHDLPVQALQVAGPATQAALERGLLNGPKDKFAMVLSSALARMQMQRFVGSESRRVFATEEEAWSWLLEESA